MIRRLSLALALSVVAVGAGPAVAAPVDAAKPHVGGKKEKDSYTLELKAVGPYKKGVEGTLELVLKSKPGYHVNGDYPSKFKLAVPAPDGVIYPKTILTKDDGKFGEHEATFKPAFRANNAGKQKLGGTMHFSVCSDKNCFVEKVDVDVEVDVT